MMASDLPRSPQERFQLNERTYARDFLPVYEQLEIHPRTLVQFPIILPFHVPFKGGLTLTFGLDASEACTFTFGTISTLHEVHAGIVSDDPVRVPQHRTRVEMTYVAGGETELKLDEKSLTEVFELMVSKLNSLITAYMVVTKDYRVHPVSTEMFEFGSLYRIIDPAKWKDAARGLFLLHWQVPFEKPELPTDLQERIVSYTTVVDNGLNPFVLTEELSLTARRQLLTGSFREAVISAQTAVETLLTGVLARAMAGEGAAEDSIDQFMQDVPFMRRVRTEYHPRFGGDWKLDQPTSQIGEWYNATYQLRNRIVHAGHQPTRLEAAAAVEAAQSFRRYVVSLIKASKNEYPSLQKFFFDTPAGEG
jgi:hypothetical protein